MFQVFSLIDISWLILSVASKNEMSIATCLLAVGLTYYRSDDIYQGDKTRREQAHISLDCMSLVCHSPQLPLLEFVLWHFSICCSRNIKSFHLFVGFYAEGLLAGWLAVGVAGQLADWLANLLTG